MSAVQHYLEICFSGANLPATALLILVCLYSLVAIVAGLGLDFFDFDLDVDGEPDLGESLGVGMVVLRFLNLGAVPLMVWGSVFAVTWWLVSMLLDRLVDDPQTRAEWFYALQYTIRNLVLAVVLTKLFTQPLRGKFDAQEPHPARELVGQQCRVTSSEVTGEFGQAEYPTPAAPLRLHVRTRDSQPLVRGDTAVIVGFDAEKNIYFVQSARSEG